MSDPTWTRDEHRIAAPLRVGGDLEAPAPLTEPAVLARCPRRGGRQELRIAVVPDTNGRVSLELRVWFLTRQSTWEPTGTVVTVYESELPALRAALDRVLA